MRSTRLHCNSIAGHQKAANQLVVTVSLVAAVWLAAVSRCIVRDAVVPWDSKNQFYAFFRFLSGTLRSEDWPFWNPYHYGGYRRPNGPSVGIGVGPGGVGFGVGVGPRW